MKFVFDPNQKFQLDAVKSVVNIFAGQPQQAPNFYYPSSLLQNPIISDDKEQLDLATVLANQPLLLNQATLAENVFAVQRKNNLPKSDHITKVNSTSDVASENSLTHDELTDTNDYTIEMETGTGKTYVYLRTIFELNKAYGWTKFIIVVPRIAIKEGVIKSYKQMKDHFAEIYNAPQVHFYEWNSKKRGIGKQFATSTNIEIMVLNIDGFTRTNTIFNRDSDWGKPLQFIAATNPIIILDEPQNMESDKRRSAIDSLNPLFSLRYSATHKEIKNLVYSLNPVQAYNQGLVKQIEVDSVLSASGNKARLLDIGHKSKNEPYAKLAIDSSEKAGMQGKVVNVFVGDELADLVPNNPKPFAGWVVDTIDTVDNYVQFTNGEVLQLGVANANERMAIMKTQIDQTVRNHLEKQLTLKPLGIKVLSLFFIDRVANYINGGFLAEMFEEAYTKYAQYPRYKEVTKYDVKTVHSGYFSVDKKGIAKDSRDTADGATGADDISAYDKILKQKERLISFSEPLGFLFSHTALREGWDNPNVFQICTLNETVSIMKKRQEIGRGLRLAVNQDGARIFDRSVNVLTVIANESYDEFATKLQQEIQEDTGVTFEKTNIRKTPPLETVAVKSRKDLTNNADFMQLWAKISTKTTYTLHFDETDLVERASVIFKDKHIALPRIKVTKTQVIINNTNITGNAVNEAIGEKEAVLAPGFDVVGTVQRQTYLKRKTINEIIQMSGQAYMFARSPHNFADALIFSIEQAKEQSLIDGITYKKLDEKWAISLFDNEELETAMRNLYKPENDAKTALNFVPIDSGVEYEYAHALDNEPDVRFYFKLPRGFKIPTPLGNYRPDWAVVFEQDKRIYFVSETKGTEDANSLKPSELLKITYARKHFTAIGGDVRYIAPTPSLQNTINQMLTNR